jgi:flagellar basal-body rod modification protein FlgD
MSISTVGGVSATASNAMGLQDFLKILLTQLQYQDPLKPMDNQQFMAQMAQFTSLEQTQQLNEKMTTLISNQAALQSIGLIGRNVDFLSSSGTTLQGQVTSLALSDDSPKITVSQAGGIVLQIDLAQITAVR